MSDCPRCAAYQEAALAAEAANAQQRDTIWALERAVTDARRAEANAKTQAAKRHEEAAEAHTIRQCLDVWLEYCWTGKGKKPNVNPDGARAARVREFLAVGFEAEDICDAFRGLGHIPFEGDFGERFAEPGLKRDGSKRQRKNGGEHALRMVKENGRSKGCPDEARLERFRDFYRRVQASPAERLREQWEQSRAVTDGLFTELLRARSVEEREQEREAVSRRGHLFAVPDPDEEAA